MAKTKKDIKAKAEETLKLICTLHNADVIHINNIVAYDKCSFTVNRTGVLWVETIDETLHNNLMQLFK
jgi:hypothetical protein